MGMGSCTRRALAALVISLFCAPVVAQSWGDHKARCLRVSDDDGTTTTCICATSDQIWHDTNCDQTKDAGENFIDSVGDVVGPSSSTDNCIVRFDSTTGKLLQEGTGCPTYGDTGEIVANQIAINHTAVASDEHALRIFADAAGFGDIKAIDIDLVTGAIAVGEDEEAIFIEIDKFLSSGGNVVGIEVVTTEGTAATWGMEAGAQVGPIVQISGAFGDMDSALVLAIDRKAEFISTASDIAIFVVDNDTVTIGDGEVYEEIEFIFDTFASVDAKLKFEFSIGENLWTEFFPADGTDGATQNGVIVWLLGDIPSWAVGVGTEYLIRITREKGTLQTGPVEDLIQIVKGVEFKWDKDGSLLAKDYSFEGSTDDAFETLLTVTDPTADRTVTIPDESGTVCIGQTGAGCPTGDTNVECFSMFDADGIAATNDIPSVFQAPAAVTVTAISCESDAATDITINLNKDDACDSTGLSTTNMETGDLQCGTVMTAGVVTTAGGEDNLADGDCVDLEVVAVTAAVRVNICMEFTFD